MAKLRVTAGLNELLSLGTFFAAAKKVTRAPGRGSANRPLRIRDPAKTKNPLNNIPGKRFGHSQKPSFKRRKQTPLKVIPAQFENSVDGIDTRAEHIENHFTRIDPVIDVMKRSPRPIDHRSGLHAHRAPVHHALTPHAIKRIERRI